MHEFQESGAVVHFVTNVGGGVWSMVKTLAEYQRPRWRVLLVGVYKGELRPAFSDEIAQHFDGSQLVRKPGFPGSYHLLPLNVGAALKRLGVNPHQPNNVFHFHTGPYSPLVFRLPRGRQPGRWLATFHGSRGTFGDAHSALKLALHRRCVRRMIRDGFQLSAVSSRSAQDCARMYGCHEEHFQVLYNGTGERGDSRGDSAAMERTQPHKPFHVGFIGTVTHTKGWRKVVDAVERLRQDGRDARCSIVGEGDEYETLQRVAARHAEWLSAPGHVHNPKTKVLPDFDVLVLPSDFEGHPLVLLEAMSAGVPCICSDVGGNAETIRHGQDGFVLRDSSATEIVQRISEILDRPELWGRLAGNCRTRHQDMFTADQMARRWEAHYLEGLEPSLASDALLEPQPRPTTTLERSFGRAHRRP